LSAPEGFLRSLAANLAASLVGLLVLLVLMEAGLRIVTWSGDPRVLVYPRVASDINGFKDPGFKKSIPPGQFRILALGASAFVTREFQPRFQDLMNAAPLFRDRGLRVRVVSTGVPAHMTYDSLWKYEYWYRGYDFDLVTWYHAINDSRANNYPRSVFREDYTQLPYFRQYAPIFAWIVRHPHLSRSFAVSLVAKLVGKAWIRFSPAFQRDAPYNDPRNDPWLPEGADIKTAPVFERNLETFLSLAKARGQRVLLLTYAYYLPADYTNERFLAKQTGYSFMPESVATEVWGRKENVVKAIETHNAITRKVAARHPEAIFFDMEKWMPKDRAHFIDICHWTNLGRRRFAEGVLKAIEPHRDDLLGPASARR